MRVAALGDFTSLERYDANPRPAINARAGATLRRDQRRFYRRLVRLAETRWMSNGVEEAINNAIRVDPGAKRTSQKRSASRALAVGAATGRLRLAQTESAG